MSAETVKKQDGYVCRRQQFSGERCQKEKGNYFPEERYELKLWDISVASLTECRDSVMSLSQSLRPGLHGRRLFLKQLGNCGHT